MRRHARSIRFDARTWMLIKEISERLDVTTTAVVRALVTESLEKLLDKEGNLTLKQNAK